MECRSGATFIMPATGGNRFTVPPTQGKAMALRRLAQMQTAKARNISKISAHHLAIAVAPLLDAAGAEPVIGYPP